MLPEQRRGDIVTLECNILVNAGVGLVLNHTENTDRLVPANPLLSSHAKEGQIASAQEINSAILFTL